MKLFQIIMNEQEKNNLVAFLERATMSGKEVLAFSAVMTHVLQAVEVQEVSNADHQ